MNLEFQLERMNKIYTSVRTYIACADKLMAENVRSDGKSKY